MYKFIAFSFSSSIAVDDFLLELRASKLNNLFCSGSTTSSLIKLLKSTRSFVAFFLCFVSVFSFFLLSLSTIWPTESFFHRFLYFFVFLLILSVLISFFLFRFGALIFSFFVFFISVLIYTFTFVFLCFLLGFVSGRTICNFFCCIFLSFFFFA